MKLHRNPLVRGGLVVGAGILLGNITGFFRVAVTAYLLGTHARADALAVAIGPLDTFNNIIVNTMLFAFVPMLMLRRDDDRSAFFARAREIFALILVAAGGLIAIFAPQLAMLLGPGLAQAQHEQATLLLRILAPSTVLAGISGVYSALLYTERRFLVPGLYSMCQNAATLGAALVLWNIAGINGFAIGYTTGTAFQLLLTWLATRDLRGSVGEVPRSGDEAPLSEILVRPGMFMLYALLIAGNVVVTRAFATHAGSGMAAAFEYCMRGVNVAIAYLIYPVAATLVPEISRLQSTNSVERAYKLIDRSVGWMAIAAVASCVFGLLLRTPVIVLLFQRGNFTADSTRLVSAVFLGLGPGVAGWALMDLLARCLFAMSRPKLPLAAALIPIAVNLGVTSVLHAQGKLRDPALLGLGASIGFAAGFVVLFAMIHVRRRSANLAPSLVLR